MESSSNVFLYFFKVEKKVFDRIEEGKSILNQNHQQMTLLKPKRHKFFSIISHHRDSVNSDWRCNATLGRFAPSCARRRSSLPLWTSASRRGELKCCWGFAWGTKCPECNCSREPEAMERWSLMATTLQQPTHRFLTIFLESFTAKGADRGREAEQLRVNPRRPIGERPSRRVRCVNDLLDDALKQTKVN